mmetsp:Transcript_25761/g.43417  ORF Transcript_25761/g.43417 Transcript_25761/m.43417 type:complete len:95 (+) Transcript_25761:43-327(+)
MNFVLCFLAILSIAYAFDCGMHNNDCLGCIQATAKKGLTHSCSYCPVDAICHTVGSLFNKCTSSECISLSSASSCELKTADDCTFVKPYGKHLR